jgi:hypothetical protein
MVIHPVRLVVVTAVLPFLWSCGGSSGSKSTIVLSAARNLVGTWKAMAPTTVSFSTDSCVNAPTAMTLAGTQPWTPTFIITSGADDNHVYVQMSFVSGAYTQADANACSSPIIVPEVSPMFLTGVISSTQLTLYNGSTPAGVFNFTTDILTGTFDYTWTAVYSQREYTATNTMILTRQ